MNKRFSTLLAAALVAGGFSSAVMATGTLPDKTDSGKYTFLTSDVSSKVLSLDTDGKLVLIDKPAAGTMDKLDISLWKVTVNEKSTVNGVFYTYEFVNKATGQKLSVKGETNNGGVMKDGAASIKLESGISEWAWDANQGLYAIKGDSVFSLATNSGNDGLTLKATKEQAAPATKGTEFSYGDLKSETAIDLQVKDFNALLKNGKLYFNGGKDASSDEANVLRDNSWKAYPYSENGSNLTTEATKFFLTNGVTKEGSDNAMTAKIQKKQFLVVDYSFYDQTAAEPAFNKLAVDTIGFEPTFADRTDALTQLQNMDTRLKQSKRHPFTAGFSAQYYIANDSIVLVPLNEPTSIAVNATLAALEPSFTSSATHTEFDKLTAAVKGFYTYDSGTNGNLDAKAVFATQTFTDSDGKPAASSAPSSSVGADLLKAAKEEIAKIDPSTGADATEKAKLTADKAAANAFMDAIDGLKMVEKVGSTGTHKVTTTKYVNNKNFENQGILAPADPTSLSANEVVIRQLSNKYVLTIAAKTLDGNIAPLIQPYKTAPGIGGDAEIAEGVYFIKDMNKLDGDKANAGYGYFFNESPVGPEYIAKEQAFNPFAQYVIKKAAGTEKGNYVIENLGGEDASIDGGVTFKVSDGVYAIGTDTFSVVAASTDLKNLDKHMGYKYISEADAINNKFTITSAADVLFGQTIVMLADSSLKVADAEMLFTLKPQPADKEEEDKYGYEDSLVRIPVAIMNADSAYIANVDGQYVFTNGKKETASGNEPAKFYLIGADTDSTFVLYDGTNKMVISTQYKTISAGVATANNDLFIIKPEAAPASYKSLPKHIRVQAANGDFAAVNADNQGVAVREGDLKSDAYSNLDFIFWLDTAKYTDAAPYKYYVTKGVKAEGETPASRMYMWNAQDSTVAAVKDKTPYMAGTATRVLFRTASIMSQDTLLVPTMNGVAKIDTVSFKENEESKDGLKHAVKAGLNSYQFSFVLADKDAEGEYNIVDGDKNYVHSQNGVLVMGGKEDALVVNVLNVSADDVIATDNEQINANGVKVIATEGGVTIKGAQGKAVVINNVLGQTIAQTVLSSDNETIAAPAGVVVVNVEGEASVKAIVK